MEARIYSLLKTNGDYTKSTKNSIKGLKERGGSGVNKTSLAYSKVKPAIELLLFTESQNLRL